MTELPPLPDPDTHCWDDDAGKDCWSHSKEQVRAYAALVRAQALEDAAQVCEAIVASDEYAYADECAAAIRAFAVPPVSICRI